MLSGRWLSHLDELHIIHGTWPTDRPYRRVLFRCLSTFTGIRKLTLRNIKLTSAMEILDILVVLPNLHSLACVDIWTQDEAYGRMPRLIRPHRLRYLLRDRVNGLDRR